MSVVKEIKNDLSESRRSYRFIVYRAFFDLANERGEAEFEELANYYKEFYLARRKQDGIQVESSGADEAISKVSEKTPLNKIKKHLKDPPLKHINYLSQENEVIKMEEQIWANLTRDDIQSLRAYFEEKIREYFNNQAGGYKMTIPETTKEEIVQACRKFDEEYRDSDRWANFTEKKNYKYAIEYDGELYPVKKIISLATGDPVSTFSGGNETNNHIKDKDFEIVDLVELIDQNSPQVWWVNQGKTYEKEKDLGILWAPLETEKGQTIHHWETLKEVEVGDIVLHYAKGTLKAVSQVKVAAKEMSKPEKLDNDNSWEEKGRLIETEYHEFEEEINLNQFNQQVLELNLEKGPININGAVNQGYLFYFSSKALKIVQKNSEGTDWPKFCQLFADHQLQMNKNIKNTLGKIKEYIKSQGFNYPDGLIKNFYLSLKTKSFVLLAGISGTGKTKLTQLFAEAIGCISADQFKIIPVRPDWSDPSDLLGYKDLDGNFRPGPLIDIIQQANKNEDQPHIVCLDEMNLARVEYYFSDILSALETRKKIDGSIKSEILLKEEYFTNDQDRDKYANLRLPNNLYFIGTINMDETTHPFSKKVLDRANTIEFSQVELDKYTLNQVETEQSMQASNQFLASEYLTLSDCSEGDQDIIDWAIEKLQEINKILKLDNLHVGYRVRDEICFYLIYNDRYELLDFETAFDYQLQQKILPRIQGSSHLVKEVLVKLFNLSSRAKLETDSRRVAEEAFKHLKAEGKEVGPYPSSAEKLAYMIKRFEEDGFTAYWL